MPKNTKKLKEFQKWFDRYIAKNFGKKCTDFTWNCPVCHAYFVKEVFDDFINDVVETENWFKNKRLKAKTKR